MLLKLFTARTATRQVSVRFLRWPQWLVWGLLLLVGGLGVARVAMADGTYAASAMSAYPPNLSFGGGSPMMMLVASRDHTLFAPIFTDFEDIDGDGQLDYTYKRAFRYYGYFDQDKCYQFNSSPNTGGLSRFEPVVMANVVAADNSLACPANGHYWLGNFLNWATMTRIDVIRKMLYGGYRAEDLATDTTLQLAHMSQDAHSFVKYYGGTDIGDFTPFTNTDLGGQGLTICNRGSVNAEGANTPDKAYPLMRLAKGNFSLWATIPTAQVCRWSTESNGYAFGDKTRAFFLKYGFSSTPSDVTSDATRQAQSHKTTVPVLATDAASYSSGANTVTVSELPIRVEACVASTTLVRDKRCRAYTSTSADGVTTTVYKPIGILQDYGTSASVDQAAPVEFGLLTGSYDWNLRGGALRKNMGALNDEVDLASGRFCYKMANPPVSCRNPNGIIKAFDAIRLYQIGSYNTSAKALGLGDFPLPDQLLNGAFSSWGNPMSEMLVQALSYLAHKGLGNTGMPTLVDSTVGLPTAANAAPIDPFADTLDAASQRSRASLYGQGLCRPVNMLAISSGSTNFDTDEGDGNASSLYTLFNGISTAKTVADWTNLLGKNEGINGSMRSVGAIDGGFGVTGIQSASCTAKQVGLNTDTGLASVAGICPDSPGIKGTYLGAGAAYFANTHTIRSELADSALNLPAYAGRVKTYAASLAGGVARIEVPIPGTGGARKAVITPESNWDHGLNEINPGAMLTFRAIGTEAKRDGDGKDANFVQSGTYVVTWNDTQFGGDYDMDLVGFLRWELYADADHAGEYRLDVLTDVLAHDAGAKGSHGFSITGTAGPAAGRVSTYTIATDGRYLTHGSNDLVRTAACQNYAAGSLDYLLHCRFANTGMAKVYPDVNGITRDNFAWPTTLTVTSKGVPTTYKVDFIDRVGPGLADATTTTRTSFRLVGGADVVDNTLHDPLWYAAKYGSFDTGETGKAAVSTDALPDSATSTGAGANRNWDRQHNDGSTCAGANCADGEPDGYFLARRPDLLEARLRNLFEGLSGNTNAAVAVSSSQLITGSLKYEASFKFAGNVRYGVVQAFELTSTGAFANVPSWDAGQQLKQATVRQVITNGQDPQTSTKQVGVAFNYDALNTSLYKATGANMSAYLDALAGGDGADSQAYAKKLISYVRGVRDPSVEGVLFATRDDNNVMGAVVDSSPWLQDPASSARISDAQFPNGPSYSQFVLGRAANNKVLWVGANDGLLYGFDGLTGAPLLSYMPSPLVGQLGAALAAGNATPVPLMDGSPFTADVLSTAAKDAVWRTYLFSGLGRGGKAFFALDVTDTGATSGTAGSLTEDNAASVFKWMFTSADNADLGHVLMDPVVHGVSGQASPVARMNNGKFAVLVPNGYGSTNGHGALFVLFVDGPSEGGWRQITATNATGDYVELQADKTDAGNGYMGATWVDLDGNGTADVIYVTDLLGHVWKFDVRDSNPANWKSAFISTSTGAAVPFYVAQSREGTVLPITTSPVVTFPSYGGVMLSFGTGKSIVSGDFPNTAVTQRFFSVWDHGRYAEDQVFPPATKDAAGNTITEPVTPPALPRGTDSMLEILLARDESTGVVYRYTMKGATAVPVPSNNLAASFNPNDPLLYDGWFFNFPLVNTQSTGEQLIFSPTARRTFISFTTSRPLSADQLATSCTVTPKGTFYAINPSTGQAINGLLNTETIGDGSGGDAGKSVGYGGGVADQRVTVTSGGTTLPGSSGAASCGLGKIRVHVDGQTESFSSCVPLANLRVQWREISGMRTK